MYKYPEVVIACHIGGNTTRPGFLDHSQWGRRVRDRDREVAGQPCGGFCLALWVWWKTFRKYVLSLLLLLLVFWDRATLCSPGWPQTWNALASAWGLEHEHAPPCLMAAPDLKKIISIY
jgi:hypothetical protein